MNRMPTSTNPTESPCRISIIYEDRAAGLRAKLFADSLAAAIRHEGDFPIAMWRCELLDLPEMVDLASRETADAEFVILSLRGDVSLPVATKHYVEAWLGKIVGKQAGLVALFDPKRGDRRIVGSVCSYLQHVTSAAGVTFFSQQSLAPIRASATARPSFESKATGPEQRRRKNNGAQLLSQTAAA